MSHWVLHNSRFKCEQQKPPFLGTELYQDVKAQLWVSESAHLGFPTLPLCPCLQFFFLKKINWIFCSKWNLLKWIETNPGCAREEREEGKGITQLVLFPLCTSKELGFLQPAHLPYGLLHTVRTVFSGNIYTCMEIYV